MAGENVKEKGKNYCPALIVIKILSGDTTLIKGYFFKMLAMGWFEYVRMLPQYWIECFADDLCGIVRQTLHEKSVEGSLKLTGIKSFIWKIVRNRSSNENKRLKRLQELESNQNGEWTKFFDNYSCYNSSKSHEAEIFKKIWVSKILEKLTPFERFLVCCVYYEECSNIELAEIIGVSPNYAGVILFMIREKILKMIEDLIKDSIKDSAEESIEDSSKDSIEDSIEDLINDLIN